MVFERHRDVTRRPQEDVKKSRKHDRRKSHKDGKYLHRSSSIHFLTSFAILLNSSTPAASLHFLTHPSTRVVAVRLVLLQRPPPTMCAFLFHTQRVRISSTHAVMLVLTLVLASVILLLHPELPLHLPLHRHYSLRPPRPAAPLSVTGIPLSLRLSRTRVDSSSSSLVHCCPVAVITTAAFLATTERAP